MNKKHQFFSWTQPDPTHYKITNSDPNPTRPNPWVDPTDAHLWLYGNNNANRSRIDPSRAFSNCHLLFRYLHRSTRIVALGTITNALRACNAVRASTDVRITNDC